MCADPSSKRQQAELYEVQRVQLFPAALRIPKKLRGIMLLKCYARQIGILAMIGLD